MLTSITRLPLRTTAWALPPRSWRICPARVASRLLGVARVATVSTWAMMRFWASGDRSRRRSFMQKLLAHRVRQEPAEAPDSIRRGLVNLKQPFRTGKFQNNRSLRRGCSKLYITIPAMRLRHAAKQHFHASCVELGHLGKVEDYLGSIRRQERAYIVQELT